MSSAITDLFFPGQKIKKVGGRGNLSIYKVWDGEKKKFTYQVEENNPFFHVIRLSKSTLPACRAYVKKYASY